MGEAKIAIFISCLRGKARVVFENVQDVENLRYNELKSKLVIGRRKNFHHPPACAGAYMHPEIRREKVTHQG